MIGQNINLEEKNMFRGFKKVKEIFATVNRHNSMMGVQCIAPEKCLLRFTTACNNCENNIGEYKDKNFYKPREEKKR